MEKRRRIALGIAALLFAVALNQRPLVDLRIDAPLAAPPAPSQMRAALDLGLSGVTILVTWGADRLTR